MLKVVCACKGFVVGFSSSVRVRINIPHCVDRDHDEVNGFKKGYSHTSHPRRFTLKRTHSMRVKSGYA